MSCHIISYHLYMPPLQENSNCGTGSDLGLGAPGLGIKGPDVIVPGASDSF